MILTSKKKSKQSKLCYGQYYKYLPVTNNITEPLARTVRRMTIRNKEGRFLMATKGKDRNTKR